LEAQLKKGPPGDGPFNYPVMPAFINAGPPRANARRLILSS
jgi:hypothetical protein